MLMGVVVEVRCLGRRRDALCPLREHNEGKKGVIKRGREYYTHDRVELHKFLVHVQKHSNSSQPVTIYHYSLFILYYWHSF
jgi:hypothetical protein